MRGTDQQQSQMFSYLSPETRVRKDHPLRAIREMVDEVLRTLSPQFDRMYPFKEGRFQCAIVVIDARCPVVVSQ